ncbi:MAG: phosphoribosylglycinamide synthetase C domain-containing protein [Candidatus Micrarchaeota archaeon]|nr:phosphoribosylglycinamide synthetase C domain-containing protein [Candidatus Micrarchaeota archaeon]
MKILLVGDDARAHVLAEQLAKNSELYCLMNKFNFGIAKLTQKYFICEFSNFETIVGWAIRERIDLAIIIDEHALFSGLSDALEEGGIKIVSPKMAAAAIGNNRVYAKNIARSLGIAQPNFYVCKNKKEIEKAANELKSFVIKPALRMDWQGIRIIETNPADKKNMLSHCTGLLKKHGSVILERKVEGEEFVVHAFSDGQKIAAMAPIQPIKQLLKNDEGRITEGMGSYSVGKLLPFMRQSDYEIAQHILSTIVEALKSRGSEFIGVLHGSFMITKTGVVLLDLKASFGKPEGINAILLLNTSITDILQSITKRKLIEISVKEKISISKCLVPENYPDNGKKENEITINEQEIWNNGARYYVDSVKIKRSKLYTTNSRTLVVYAEGNDLDSVEQKTENSIKAVVGKLKWREDIATSEFLSKRIKHMEKIRSNHQ